MAEAALIGTLVAALLFLASRRRASPRPMSDPEVAPQTALQGDVGGRTSRVYVAAVAVVWTTVALLASLLVVRSVRIGFPALTGSYEGMVALSLAVNAFVAAVHRRVFRESGRLLAAATFVSFVYQAILSSPLVSADLYPPLPVLRSGWLVLHVAFSFVGLALFSVGFVAAVAGLASGDERRAEAADRVRDRSIVVGLVFYATGGIVFGAIWAENAWGRFWGWDPKETWALVTSLFYYGYIHLRFVRRVKPTVARVVAIVAFVLAIFTFWGVNLLFAGLHSYA